MGQDCSNKTYEFNGAIYHLVDAVLLWSTNSYDGPLAGIACYKAFACYARSYTFYRDRSYWIYPLRASEWDAEIAAHVNHQEIDRSRYAKRKPLGFFRIDYKSEPLGTNRLGTEWHQLRYPQYFEEVLSDAEIR